MMINVMLQESISIVFEEQGKLEEAEQTYNQTLQIRVKVFGDDTLDVAKVQKNIADICSAPARYDEAVEMYPGVVHIQERVLGRDQPDVAATYGNIGCVYTSQGKYQEALKMHQKCLRIEEKIHGPEHPDVAMTKVSLCPPFCSFMCLCEDLWAGYHCKHPLDTEEAARGACHVS